MINQKDSKKFFAYLFPILILIMLSSCEQKNAKSKVNIKKKFYKILSKDNQLLSYNYRIYHFYNDTLREKCVTISLDGKIKNGSFVNKYIIKVPNIYKLSEIDNKVNKELYFSTNKEDSCYNLYQNFDKLKICYNGLKSDGRYKNVYKIYYEELGYHGNIEKLILDRDFTVISRFCENNTYKKEFLVNPKDVPQKVKITASNINE
jgi:hypothetical protein